METDNLEYCTDLTRDNLDPELFAAALVVRHVWMLIARGGSEFGRPDWDSTLHPHDLERFINRAVEVAQKTRRFEIAWHALQQIFPHMRSAWEKGQTCFQDDLTRVSGSQEEMEYLPQIDFAVDCYAYVAAMNIYPNQQALQEWFINGYMVAWRQHFLTEEGVF